MGRRLSTSALLTAVLALGALTAQTGTAEAGPPRTAHGSVHDRAGDAPASIDLLAGRYALDKGGARFTVTVDELTDDTFLAFEVWPLTDSWDRLAIYREGGRTVGKVYFVDNEEATTPYLRRCPGLRVTWDTARDRVSATWPARCLQSSAPGVGGRDVYQFHVFAKVGGVADPARDTMPVKKLRY